MIDFFEPQKKENEFKKGDILGGSYIVSDVWFNLCGEKIVDKVKLSKYRLVRYLQIVFYKNF